MIYWVWSIDPFLGAIQKTLLVNGGWKGGHSDCAIGQRGASRFCQSSKGEAPRPFQILTIKKSEIAQLRP